MAADEKLQWHRWFGLGWTDLLAGRPFSVQMERDMSVKKQLLDVVVVRRDMSVPLPDDLRPGAAQPHHVRVVPGGARRRGGCGPAGRPIRNTPR